MRRRVLATVLQFSVSFLLILLHVGNSYFHGNTELIRTTTRTTTITLFSTSSNSNNKKQLSPNVEKYLQTKELKRLKDNGVSYDELKEAILNGTLKNAVSSKIAKAGYQRFVGKGTLDQRLRNIVAYKRSVAIERSASDNSFLSDTEEEDLITTVDEGDEGEEEEISEEDDEEAQYESLVLRAIEQNKVSEVRRNMMIDLQLEQAKQEKLYGQASLSDESTASTSTKTVVLPNTTTSTDVYTPAVSTWGVYERPRDISKAYGGGRSISKEEMDRMDEEMEENKSESISEKIVAKALRVEIAHEAEIRKAMDKAKLELQRGNRVATVQAFESVCDKVSWQSDLGGDFYLQLGMALETVDRSDEARKIYGKLVTVSWSQKVRRLALQLISGLDIAKQIRKDVAPHKPIIDYAQLEIISKTLDAAVPEEMRSKELKNDHVLPWYGANRRKEEVTSSTINTLSDAYKILLWELNPLYEAPSKPLLKALQKFYFASKADRDLFYQQERPLQLRKHFLNAEKNLPPIKEGAYDVASLVNGTWDLMLSVYEGRDPQVKRFELGDLRRILQVNESSSKEVFSVFWGLNTVSHLTSFTLNSHLHEMQFFGDQVKNSKAPWQRGGQSTQSMQVRLVYKHHRRIIFY